MKPNIPETPQNKGSRQHRVALIASVAAVLSCMLLAFGVFTMSAGLIGYRWPPLRLFLIQTAEDRARLVTSSPVATGLNAALPLKPTAAISPLAPISGTATPIATGTSTPLAFNTPVATAIPSDDITTTVVETVAAEGTQRQLRVFNQLWDIVNRNYIYPDFNGVDWHEARVSVTQVISGGIGDSEFYELMGNLIDSLNDNHSVFLSPDEARQEAQDYQGSDQYTGVGLISDLNLEKQYAYVLQVLPGSPADAAGIEAHDHILAIAGLPAVDANGDSNLVLLRGQAGTSVTMTVSTPGGEPHDVLLNRAVLSTTAPVESRILSGTKRIGYVLIPTFFEQDEAQKVRDALRALTRGGALDGLILDMRINGGGSYPVLVSTLSFFTHGAAGSLVDRGGVREMLNVRTETIGNSQTAPIMVLIGPATESYAEVFAGIMRAKGRAKLVGQNSAGNIETLRSHEFEDGSQVWIAEETFHLPDGDNWEGTGLAPDIVVDKAWDDYSAQNDPVIQAAADALANNQK